MARFVVPGGFTVRLGEVVAYLEVVERAVSVEFSSQNKVQGVEVEVAEMFDEVMAFDDLAGIVGFLVVVLFNFNVVVAS